MSNNDKQRPAEHLTRQQKAALTTKARHGKDFYKRIGKEAGSKSTSAPLRDVPGLASKAVNARWNRYYQKLAEEAMSKGLITDAEAQQTLRGDDGLKTLGKLAKERLDKQGK